MTNENANGLDSPTVTFQIRPTIPPPMPPPVAVHRVARPMTNENNVYGYETPPVHQRVVTMAPPLAPVITRPVARPPLVNLTNHTDIWLARLQALVHGLAAENTGTTENENAL